MEQLMPGQDLVEADLACLMSRESMSGDNACPVHRDRMRRRGRPPRGCLCYEVPAAA